MLKNFITQNKNYIIYFFLISFLILFFNIFSPGYLLSGNMIFTPDMHIDDSSIFNVLEKILNFTSTLIPTTLSQRLLLLLAFTINGYTAFWAAKKISKKSIPIITGTLFILNPLVYEILLTGDWQFLLGMWILPLLFVLTKNFLKSLREEDLYKVVGLIAFSVLFGSSLFGIGIMLFVIMLSIDLILNKNYNNKNIQYSLVIGMLLLVLLPFMGFMSNNILNESSNNSLWTTISLQGSWARGYIFKSMFELTLLKGIFWYLISFISIYILALKSRNKKFQLYKSLALILLINSLLIFIGDSILIFLGIQPYLIAVISLFVLSITFPIGLKEITKHYKLKPYAFLLLSTTMIFLASFPVFIGGLGQLKTSLYPRSYHELSKIITNESKILVLPWSDYERYTWSENTLKNPAKSFFNAEILVSNSKTSLCDIELIDNNFDVCLNYSDKHTIANQVFKTLEIDYILVNKTDGFNDLTNLLSNDYYDQVYQDEYAVIFEVN